MERDQILMFDPVPAEHLIDQEQRVGDHHELVGPFRHGQLHRLEESGVLCDVVRRAAEVAAGFDDLAAVQGEKGAIAGRAGIATRGAIDERRDFQGATFSPYRSRRQPSQNTISPRLSCWLTAGRM